MNSPPDTQIPVTHSESDSMNTPAPAHTIDDRVSEIMWTIDKYGRGDTMTRADLEQAVRNTLCWESPRAPAMPQPVMDKHPFSLSVAGIARKHFGNPIPPAAFAFASDLIAATLATIKADHFPGVTEMVAPAQGEEAKAVAPDGWKLMPIEPDDAMQAAGAQAVRMDTTVLNKIWTGNAVYRAMVAASPVAQPLPPAAEPDKSQDAKAVADVMEYEGVIYAELRVPISLTTGTLLYTAPPPTEINKSKDAERWKLAAEYQFGLRVYPEEIGLACGALDAWITSDAGRQAISSLLDDAALQAAATKEENNV